MNDYQDRLPCTHNWVLLTKTFAPPVRSLNVSQITDSKVLEKALFGTTSYMWECNVCGEIRKQEMLGSDENQLSEIFDKVEKFGMQYIKDNGNVYAITRWVPETTSTPVLMK